MFNIQYSIKLGDESYNSHYPQNGKENHNLFIIRGANDKGKTTTLKIVAHAFGVLETEDSSISEDIRQDIETLNDKGTKLSYDISITSPDKSLKIDISYDGNEKRYSINNRPAGKTELMDKVQTLFDIPEPLQKKVEGAMNNVRNVLREYLNLATGSKDRLVDLNEQVLRYEQGENRKTDITKTIRQLEETLMNLQVHEENYKKIEKEMRKEYALSRFRKLEQQFDLKEDQLKQIENRIRESAPLAGSKRNTGKKLEQAGGDAKILIIDSKEMFLGSDLIQDLQEYEKILKKVSFLSYSDKINKKLISELDEYFKKIEIRATKMSESNSYKVNDSEKQELELITKLLEILKKFSGIDPEIPGLGKKMSDLIIPLSQRENELKKILNKSLAPENVKLKCNEIRSSLLKVSVELGKYLNEVSSKEGAEDDIDPKLLKSQKSELEEDLNKIVRELDSLEEELKDIPKVEKESLVVNPKIEELYERAKKDTTGAQEEIKRVNENLENQNKLLQKYTGLISPPTKMTSQEIKDLIFKTENLIAKLGEYLDAFERIDIKNMKIKESIGGNKEEAKDSYLLSRIGEYLADVVQIIYHNHQPYDLKKIDFENKQYIVKNGNPIKFSYLGTGHKTLNSLLAKIKQPSGGRKKIILIDEIGNMDKENQRVLINELVQEIREGRAILSLLTERSDEENEISFEPVIEEAK